MGELSTDVQDASQDDLGNDVSVSDPEVPPQALARGKVNDPNQNRSSSLVFAWGAERLSDDEHGSTYGELPGPQINRVLLPLNETRTASPALACLTASREMQEVPPPQGPWSMCGLSESIAPVALVSSGRPARVQSREGCPDAGGLLEYRSVDEALTPGRTVRILLRTCEIHGLAVNVRDRRVSVCTDSGRIVMLK